VSVGQTNLALAKCDCADCGTVPYVANYVCRNVLFSACKFQF
jgi:hypothetical protein